MGISGGPDMIQDGLVLTLDASDKNSYPGSGTTWYDLSGNGNTGTLSVTGSNAVSASFSSANGGIIVFSQTSSYVDCGNGASIQLISDMSILA